MTGTLSNRSGQHKNGTHADWQHTDKELEHRNGDIEATGTLSVGGTHADATKEHT